MSLEGHNECNVFNCNEFKNSGSSGKVPIKFVAFSEGHLKNNLEFDPQAKFQIYF